MNHQYTVHEQRTLISSRITLFVRCVVVPLIAVLLGCSIAAGAEEKDGGVATSVPSKEDVAPDSPRASVARFFELPRAGNYGEAGDYLTLSKSQTSQRAELAKRLRAVLDRYLWIDLDELSGSPEGDRGDGLAPGVEEVGMVPSQAGTKEPVRLVRAADHAKWLFSRATVSRVDAWYGELENRWLLERLPVALLRPGPRDLLLWQWIALPIFFAVATILGAFSSWLFRSVLGRVAKRTDTTWDDAIVARIGGPLTVACSLGISYALVPLLGLYPRAEQFIHQFLKAAALVVFFWTIARLVDVIAGLIAQSRWSRERPASRSLVPLASRLGKVAVLVLAVIAFLSELGYPVASLIAGLGIGGLALALAAQKTVENLFGAFSLGADQPFREGDFVKIDDVVGTVEAIGLRSTKVRTLDRTLVTIPNGKLAEMRVESFSARDRMRLACTLGLVYETTAEQVRSILQDLERALRSHPKIWTDAVVVRFKEFGDSSLNIEIMCWFQTSEYSEFQLIRQEVLLEFMGVVERSGSAFAFPTRTVHVVEQNAPS